MSALPSNESTAAELRSLRRLQVEHERIKAERDRARALAVALEQELDELRVQFEEWAVRAKHSAATRHIDDVIEDLRDEVWGERR
jgi:hypothetical protein